MANIYIDRKSNQEKENLALFKKNKTDDKKNILGTFFNKFFRNKFIDKSKRKQEEEEKKEKKKGKRDAIVNSLERPKLNLIDKPHEYEENYLFLKQELARKHNKIITTLYEDRLEKDIYIPSDENATYSIFMIKDNNLVEYRSTEEPPLVAVKNVDLSNVRDRLLEYLLSNDTQGNIKYLSDITMFNELADNSEQEVTSSSQSFIGVLILTVIFAVNFLIVMPQNTYYDLNMMYGEFISTVDGESLIGSVNSVKDIEGFVAVLMERLYDPYTNQYNYTLTSNEANKVNNSQILDDSNSTTFTFKPIHDNYYIMNANIYGGLNINFRYAIFQPYNTAENKTFSSRVSDYFYYGPVPNEKSEVILSYEKSNFNPLYPNTYNLFFKPTANENHISWYRQQAEDIFTKDLSEFDITLIFYNTDVQACSVYSIKMEIDSFNKVKITKYFHGFQPFIKNVSSKFILLLVVNIVYFVLAGSMMFNIIRVFAHAFIEFVKTRNYTLEWYDWVDLTVLLITITSEIIFLVLIFFRGKDFPVVVTTSDEFAYWLNLSLQIKQWQIITGISLMLTMIRLVRFLSTQFPTFGIVFEAVNNASSEFLAALVIVFLMILGIVTMFHSSFGWYSSTFKTVEESFITVYLMFIGIFDFNDIVSPNSYFSLAPYFFVAFMIVFNLILINIFLCVIRNNYWDIKEKREMFNRAYSLMIKDGTKEIKSKVVNLVTFEHPLKVEYDLRKEEELKNVDIFSDDEEDIKKKNEAFKDQGAENVDEKDILAQKMRQKEVGLLDRLRYNFERLDLKKLLSGDFNREEFKSKMLDKFKELRLSLLKENLDELEVNYEKEFDALVDTSCFIIFIVIFCLMFIFQLRIGMTANINKFADDKFRSLFGDTSHLATFGDVEESMTNFMYAYYENKNSTKEGTRWADASWMNCTDQFVFDSPDYKFLRSPYYRITFRLYKFVDNSLSKTKDFFPYMLTDPNPLDFSNCPSDAEYTLDFNEHEEDLSGDYPFKLSYKKPFSGKYLTPDDCGGFLYFMDTVRPSCYNSVYWNWTVVSGYLFRNNIGSVTVDWAIFNVHTDYAVYMVANFVRETVGKISFKMDTHLIPINRYYTSQDFLRAILEIAYFLFVTYYIILQFSRINEFLHIELRNEFGIYDKKERTDFMDLSRRFWDFNFKRFENEGLCSSIISIFFQVLEKTLKFTFFYINATFSYLTYDGFNLLNFLSITLSLWLVICWWNILGLTGHLNLHYVPQDDEYWDDTMPNNISMMNDLSNRYDVYILWSSVNALLILLRTLQFYRFAKSINSLLVVMKHAGETIMFHLAFITIVDIGFALMSYAFFSQDLKSFASISSCILCEIIILSGTVKLADLLQVSLVWGGLFVVIFTLLNTLILLNILSSIIIEAFYDVKHKQKLNTSNNQKMDLVSNVICIVQEKVDFVLNTAQLYYVNMRFKATQIEDKYNIYVKAVEATKLDEANGRLSFAGKLNTHSDLLKRYTNECIGLAKQCENKTVDGKICVEIKKEDPVVLDTQFNDENNALKTGDSNDKFEKDGLRYETLEKVKCSSSVSFFEKMLAYIAYKLDLPYQEIIFNDVRKVLPTNTNDRRSTSLGPKTQIKEDDIGGGTSIMKVDSNNEWLNEWKQYYRDNMAFKARKFLKVSLFDAPKKMLVGDKLDILPYSKALNNPRVFPNYIDMYYTPYVCNDILYNLNNFSKVDFSFEEGGPEQARLLEIFSSYAVLIYDILIKNFYLPRDVTLEEKDLYLSYYLYKFKHIEGNRVLKNLSKEIPRLRFDEFKTEIIRLVNIQEFYPINIDNLKNEDNADIIPFEEDDKEAKYFLKLNKIFYIWNTLYVILFRKDEHFVREIAEKSISAKVISTKPKTQNNQPLTPFTNLFCYLYKLDRPVDSDILMQSSFNFPKDGLLKDFIGMVFKKNFLENSEFEEDTSQSKIEFYKDISKYYFLDDIDSRYVNIFPKEYEEIKVSSYDQYPEIFKIIWLDLTREDQFNLFFGYNLEIVNGKNPKEIIEGQFNKPTGIASFFKNTHRGEVLSFIKFPENMNEAFANNMMVFCQKENIAISEQKLLKIKSLEDVIRFFMDTKLHYSKISEFLHWSIHKIFSKYKLLILDTHKEYKEIYQIILRNNPQFMGLEKMNEDNKEAKMNGKDFLNLMECKAKYNRLKGIYNFLTIDLYHKIGLKVVANNLNIEDSVVDVNDLVRLRLQDQFFDENPSK
jgi:hypothetical protein